MAAISAKDVVKLRQATGLGMMECKKALTEAEGDMDKAAEIVRQKFGAKMAKRSDREASEGRIAVARTDDRSKAAMVLIAAETDFTANNEAFVKMAQSVADEALKSPAVGDVTPTEPIQTAIDEVKLTTQENISLAKGQVLGGDGKTVGYYVHFNGKTGVLVEVEGEADDDVLRDLCMHVSAIQPEPLGIGPDDVPAEIVDKERAIAKQEAIDSGKPEEIAEKMVTGKVRKFVDSLALLRQPFVKDDKKRVEEILPKGVTVTAFTKYQIG